MSRSLTIDEEGFIALDGARIEDPDVGAGLLENLEKVEQDRFITRWDGVEVMVEAFDAPLVAKHVARQGERFTLTMPYGFERDFSIESLCLDEWDRFHGVTENKISFVFSRNAQMQFFDLVDEFDDDSVTVNGKRFEVPPFFILEPKVERAEFWTDLYNQPQGPGWELGEASQPLVQILPQLKMTRSRVLVLGCGSGHDAAYLANQGHIVTAVDISPEAIRRAKAQYGSIPNLEFIEADIFKMNIKGSFNLVYEHTCWPAIAPQRRRELIEIWKKHLIPGGHLLGIFLILDKRGGPPFGLSEWELRERLKKSFRFLYWTRWKQSIERRKGIELIVYAQKV